MPFLSLHLHRATSANQTTHDERGDSATEDNSLAEQPVNSVALYGTVPRDRFLDFALVLQHLEELAALKVDVALTSLELALAALQVGLHTIGQLGGVEDLARVPHCGAIVLSSYWWMATMEAATGARLLGEVEEASLEEVSFWELLWRA